MLADTKKYYIFFIFENFIVTKDEFYFFIVILRHKIQFHTAINFNVILIKLYDKFVNYYELKVKICLTHFMRIIFF